MATVIMALLYVLEGAILTVTAFVTGIKHSEFPDVRVGYHVRDAMESKEKWNDANVIAGLVSGVFAVIFFAAAILVYWNRIDTDRSIVTFFYLIGDFDRECAAYSGIFIKSVSSAKKES